MMMILWPIHSTPAIAPAKRLFFRRWGGNTGEEGRDKSGPYMLTRCRFLFILKLIVVGWAAMPVLARLV